MERLITYPINLVHLQFITILLNKVKPIVNEYNRPVPPLNIVEDKKPLFELHPVTPPKLNDYGAVIEVAKGNEDKVVGIDADTLVYASASSSQLINEATGENEITLNVALMKCKEKIEEIITATGCKDAILFFTGGKNFRHVIYPNYKDGRSTVHGRDLLQAELEDTYKCVDGKRWLIEADDALVAWYKVDPDNRLISSIDKDVLYAVAGKHYNYFSAKEYKHWKTGNVIPEKKPKWVEVTMLEAFKMPYYQCLLGDSTDNITGCKGIGSKGAEKLLRDIKVGEEEKALNIVIDTFMRAYLDKKDYLTFSYGQTLVNSVVSEDWLEDDIRGKIRDVLVDVQATMRAVSMHQTTLLDEGKTCKDGLELPYWAYEFKLDMFKLPLDNEGNYILQKGKK